jgi:hypothetical protein
LLVAALPFASCNDDSPSTPTATTSPSPSPSPITATVSGVEASSDTAEAVRSNDSAYTWMTSFNVTLTESAGVAATVRSLAATLQQSAGGIVITPPAGLTEQYRFEVRAGSNQLTAAGTLPIDFTFYYTLPNGGRQALITLTFNLVDANGVQIQVTTQVKVV